MARRFLVNVGALSASRLFLALSQVLVLPIVARYLDPVAFGDMSLAMSVIIFGQLLSDAGLGRSLIRQPTFDPREWNSVFWLLVGVGAGLMLLLLALAPVWSMVFDRPPLTALVASLSSVVALNALAAVPVANMERAERFKSVAAIRTGAGLAGVVAVVSGAALGWGVWALVAQQLVLALVQTTSVLAVSGFRPAAPRNFTPLKNHLRFASDNVGTSALFTAQTQAPLLLIGYALGPVSLGLFAMAQRFFSLPRTGLAGPMAQVVYIKMSAAQADPDKMARLYLASCRLMAIAIFPTILAVAGAGAIIFPLLLSEKWAGVALIFALAAPGIALETATAAAGVMFQAMDKTRLRLRMAGERACLRTLVVAAALPFGLNGVALGLSLFALAYLPRFLSWASRAAPIETGAVLRAILPSVLAGAIGGGGLALFAVSLSVPQLVAALVAAIICATLAAFGLDYRRVRKDLTLLRG